MASDPLARRKAIRENIPGLWAAAVFFLIPMGYWAFTGHVWEDFLITYRHAENWAAGNGLTYNIGTRVHGFTSPLSVVVPALLAKLTGNHGFELPLLLYSLIATACLATGGMLVTREFFRREQDEGRWAWCLWPLVFVLCHRISAYTVNGQETGYWVLFLAVSLVAMVRGLPTAWLLNGIGWAGLMWTRPDSPVHIIVMSLGVLLWPTGTRRQELRGLLLSAAVCTALYLPWFAWAWVYYGSPIPHTVIAKAGAYMTQPLDLAGLINQIRVGLGAAYLPIGAELGGWPASLSWIASLFGAAGILAMAVPDRLARLAAWCAFGSLLYLQVVGRLSGVFSWYYVPVSFFGSIAVIAAVAKMRGPFFRGAATVVMLLIVLEAGIFTEAARSMAAQQTIIENGIRRNVGLWLRDHVKDGERVYLEPIGYIGYYSRAHIVDYPGLVSPEVVDLRKTLHLGFYDLIDHLQPEWLVLRPSEWKELPLYTRSAPLYHAEIAFDARKQVSERTDLFGQGYLRFDAAFVILRLQTNASLAPQNGKIPSSTSRP